MIKIINSVDFVTKHTLFSLLFLRLCGRVQIGLVYFFFLSHFFYVYEYISKYKWFWRWQLLKFYFHRLLFHLRVLAEAPHSSLDQIIDGSFIVFIIWAERMRTPEIPTQKRIWAQMKIEKLFVGSNTKFVWHFFGFNVLRFILSFRSIRTKVGGFSLKWKIYSLDGPNRTDTALDNPPNTYRT